MPTRLMHLKVLLPFQTFAEKTGVLRIVAETREGSFGLLPHRLDCVAELSPGILIYETKAEGETYVAVDEGVLVKTGPDVLVSVRRAMGGNRLHAGRMLMQRRRAGLALGRQRDHRSRDAGDRPHRRFGLRAYAFPGAGLGRVDVDREEHLAVSDRDRRQHVGIGQRHATGRSHPAEGIQNLLLRNAHSRISWRRTRKRS